MIEINLLPKHYLKKGRGLSLSKAGKYGMAGAGGIVLILVGITFYQMHQLGQLEENIERASQRTSMLREDIRMVDALIDVKEKITRRMSTVERLDRHRSAWVRILEDMARNVPEFVWIGRFSEIVPKADPNVSDTAQANVVTEIQSVRPVEIEGYTFTLNALAAFMIKTMRSEYFEDVELVVANEVTFDESGNPLRSSDRRQEGQRAYNFVLSCNVHYLTEEELRSVIAAADRSGASDKSATSHKRLN